MTSIEPLLLQSTVGTVIGILFDAMGTFGAFVMIASGLSLIFGLMGVLNFAHGALTTYGAFIGAGILVVVWPTNPAGAIVFIGLVVGSLGVFVLLSAIGAGIEFTLIRRLYERPPIDQILLTFGVALTLEELLLIVVKDIQGIRAERGDNELATKLSRGSQTPDILSPTNTIDILGASIRWVYIFEFVIGSIVVVAVWAFLNKTRYGLFIRAGSEDDEMAEALGINVRRVFTLVFGVGIGLAGVSGMFLIWDPSFNLTVSLGTAALLPAFIVVVVGGLGSFKGTVVAAAIAGIFDAIGNYLFASNTVVGGVNLGEFASLPGMLIFLLLVTVLIVQPTGLFGEEEVGGH